MKNKIYISIPAKTGQVYFELLIRLLEWSHQSIPIMINFQPFTAPIDHCRNTIVKKFLTTDCTHLMMIDDDIVPPADALERLLFHNKDIIGAVCPIIGPIEGQLKVSYNAYKLKNGHLEQHGWPKSSSLTLVDVIGTGCILIKREVLENIQAPFLTEYNKEGIKQTGEDVSFCKKAGNLQCEIYADFKLKCKHIKQCNLLEL